MTCLAALNGRTLRCEGARRALRATHSSGIKIYLIAMVACTLANAQSSPSTTGPYVELKDSPDCQANALTMARCESTRAEHSGSYLKFLVEKVNAALPFSDRVPSFEKAQEAWTKFRNASCDFDSELAAGNSRGYRYAACTHTYNKARIVLLEKYLGCLKGECSNDVQLYYLVSPP
jgi:uncharacterized protein YecT (DUF1311 family)